MSDYYVDASALVKRYVEEAGTEQVNRLLDPATSHEIHVVSLGEVEVVAAISRRGRVGDALTDASLEAIQRCRAEFSSRWTIVEMTPELLAEAVRLVQPYFLRGYDAVHLAAAIHANRLLQEAELPDLTVVSADGELNAAAEAEGLRVLNPIWNR